LMCGGGGWRGEWEDNLYVKSKVGVNNGTYSKPKSRQLEHRGAVLRRGVKSK
jgi:hypothetical protein